MYQLLRNILFWFDAEEVHYFSMNVLRFFCSFSLIKNFLKKRLTPQQKISKEVFGITFSNPVGLAAGFDKNAKYLNELETLGFGFVEMEDQAAAQAAINALDGNEFEGRTIVVNVAKPREDRPQNIGGRGFGSGGYQRR